MAVTARARIGFLSSGRSGGSGSPGIGAFVPEDVHVDFIGLGQNREQNLYRRHEGTMEAQVSKINDVVSQHEWDGVAVSGAPREVLNPGILQRLEDAVPIPISTAMGASVRALRALGVGRVLSVTPFDGPLNKGIRDYIESAGIEAVSAPQTVPDYTDAAKLTPDQVFALTESAFQGAGPVDAIYFQGGVLDPLPLLQRLEDELETPVVTSNTAMLWYIVSRVGLSYHIKDAGRLLGTWPDIS